MNSVSGTRSINDFYIYVKPPASEGYSQDIDGFAILRSDMMDEYRAYMGPLERASRQEDMAAAKKAANQPIKVTNEQINQLAEKYDPRNMTYEEYNAFIDEMIEMGVVTKEDASYITDYANRELHDWLHPGNPYLSSRTLYGSEAPYFYRGCTYPLLFPECNGDVLTMYGFQAAYHTTDPETGTVYRGRTERTYGKIYQVLQRMDKQSPYSEQRAKNSTEKMQESYQKSYQTSRLGFDLRNSRIAAPATAVRR